MKKLDELRNYMVKEDMTEQTMGTYIYHLEHFLNTNPKARWYDYAQLSNAINKEKGRGSYRVFIYAIKFYYQFLFDQRYRTDNPAAEIDLGRRKKFYVQFQDLLTPPELEELLNARENRYNGTTERNKVIISLLIYQGLTSGEIADLKVTDIDLDACTVSVKKSNTNNARVLNMNPKQIKIFMDYLAIRDKFNRYGHDELLLGVRHRPYTVDAVNRMLQQLKHIIPSKKVNASIIRQSVIANWLNIDKKAIADVQILAGHKYPSSTQHYYREDPEEKRKLINQFHPLIEY